MNFNDALNRAADLAKARLSTLQEDVFLVRDLNGRIRVLLASPDHGNRTKNTFEAALKGLNRDVVSALGTYAYPQKELFLFRSELANISLPTSAAAPVLREDAGYKVCLHDRLLMGAEWSSTPPSETPNTKRFTLFSMKGGVGRSTTAAVLSWHLATQHGKRVLVFDLDLESPGVGSTLLGEQLPSFGIVDWFVEDALGHTEAVLDDMVRESTLATGPGTILVAPAFGSETGDYLAKLGRAYLERGPTGREAWPKRLKRMVESLERRVAPDIVILDSRTGLHDASAALVLAMGADTLMFAVNSPQTWSAYHFLFQHWALHPDRRAFREKLWIVGAQIPDTGREEYTEALRDNAWELFRATLYDEPGDGLDPDVLFAPPEDSSGNHFPRSVYWQRSLMAFNPLASWAENDVNAGYGDFLRWFDRTLLGDAGAL